MTRTGTTCVLSIKLLDRTDGRVPSPTRASLAHSPFQGRALIISLTVLLCLAMASPSMLAAEPLNFFKNYFVTGDYAVGGVGLRGLGSNGFATGTIHMADPSKPDNRLVPKDAGIVAAYLYWETLTPSLTPTGSPFPAPGCPPTDPAHPALARAVGCGTFRGNPIVGKQIAPTGTDPLRTQPLACWSSGGGNGTTNGA